MRLSGLFQYCCHLPGGAPFQPQLQIEPIQQRAGEPLPVALALADAAATAMVAVAMPAAGAGIGGGHQGDQGREHRALLGTADLHGAVLQGLPQLIQDRPRKFRQLIKRSYVSSYDWDLG